MKKNLLSYLGMTLLAIACVGMIGLIGANIEMADASIKVFQFKNIFLGVMKIAPLLLFSSFTFLIYQRIKK